MFKVESYIWLNLIMLLFSNCLQSTFPRGTTTVDMQLLEIATAAIWQESPGTPNPAQIDWYALELAWRRHSMQHSDMSIFLHLSQSMLASRLTVVSRQHEWNYSCSCISISLGLPKRTLCKIHRMYCALAAHSTLVLLKQLWCSKFVMAANFVTSENDTMRHVAVPNTGITSKRPWNSSTLICTWLQVSIRMKQILVQIPILVSH